MMKAVISPSRSSKHCSATRARGSPVPSRNVKKHFLVSRNHVLRYSFPVESDFPTATPGTLGLEV